MYRLKYNKVIFLVNISLHEYSSSFVFTQNLKNTPFTSANQSPAQTAYMISFHPSYQHSFWFDILPNLTYLRSFLFFFIIFAAR